MSKDYSNLIEKFPLLYSNNCVKQYGFDCREGWYDIIHTLSEKIEIILISMKENGTAPENIPHVSQVKEKFSTLRFYMSSYVEEIELLISKAEKESGTTCEFCGSKEEIKQVHPRYWLKTLCPTCTKEYTEKLK